jgi:hypothetical protein
MLLSAKQQREIRQLMYVARHYLRCASPAKKESLWKLGDTAPDFRSGLPPSRKTRRLALLGAHLSSAAIRLATVEKVLYKAKAPTGAYKACEAYYYDLSGSQFPAPSDCLHIFLRDSIGHAEPPEISTSTHEPRWEERQKYIEALPFPDAYTFLEGIDRRLREHLTRRHKIKLLAVSVRP